MEAVAKQEDDSPCRQLGYAMFPSTKRAPGDARRWAHELLGWLDESALFNVDVMVSELVTNAFLHTEAAEIWVELTHIEGVLRVGVTDDGSGEWGEPGAGREGGRGLELVELLSDCWCAEGVNCVGATQVWFELKVAG